MEVLFCGDNLEPDEQHGQGVLAIIRKRMSEEDNGKLTLKLSADLKAEQFPAFQMCPFCGHNLCNNETLTGVELQYIVQEQKEGEWQETNKLKIVKDEIMEEGEPTMTWNYGQPFIFNKLYRMFFTTGFKEGDREIARFPIEFEVSQCPADCQG